MSLFKTQIIKSNYAKWKNSQSSVKPQVLNKKKYSKKLILPEPYYSKKIEEDMRNHPEKYYVPPFPRNLELYGLQPYTIYEECTYKYVSLKDFIPFCTRPPKPPFVPKWKIRHSYNSLKPNRYMLYRKELIREWETTNMHSVVYKPVGPRRRWVYEDREKLERLDLTYPSVYGNEYVYTIFEIEPYFTEVWERPFHEEVEKEILDVKHTRFGVIASNYYEHDYWLSARLATRLKIERCIYRDGLPDLVVYYAHPRKMRGRIATVIFTRHGENGPMMLSNIMIFDEKLFKERILRLGYRSTRSSYASVSENKDLFNRLALIRIPHAEVAIHFPWHREVPMDGLDC